MTLPNKLVSGSYTELAADMKTAGFYRVKFLAKQTGTGAQQAIAHGLAVTPTAAQIILSEADTGLAIPYQSAAPDATNVNITAVNLKTYNVAIFY